jgi:hypothetical protein
MKGRLQKKIIAFFSGILLIVSLISFLLNTEAVMPSYLITIESIMLLFFSILFFYQLLDHPYEQNLLTMGEFWLNSSVCVYCMGSFFFWASFYYLYRHHIVLPGLKVIMDTLDILHYLLLGLAIFFYSRRESLIMHEHSKR